MNRSLLFVLAFGLTACPSPTEERSHVAPPQVGQPQGQDFGGGQEAAAVGPQQVEEGAPPPDDGEQGPLRGHVEDYGSGSPPLDEEGEGDMRVVDPTHSQEDIAGAPNYEVSGRVVGDCAGDLRIDVLSTRPLSDVAGDVGPMTAVDLSSVGAFSVLVPEGESVELFAVCDANGDGVIRGGDSLSAPDNSEQIGSARDNVVLRLQVLDSVLPPTSGGLVVE
jgi:hypothetical protein